MLLWAAVTGALWAALPLAMYLSHWQWFGWMPRMSSHAPAVAATQQPSAHSSMMLSMASFLLMSSVLMAVVLWILSLKSRNGKPSRD